MKLAAYDLGKQPAADAMHTIGGELETLFRTIMGEKLTAQVAMAEIENGRCCIQLATMLTRTGVCFQS